MIARFTVTVAAMAIGGALFGAVLAAPAAAAGQTQEIRLRGTVASVVGSVLTVRTRDGAPVEVALVPGWKISGVVRASIEDIHPGDYVGVATLPNAQGVDGALEVLIFPPALKGTAEGRFGWDLQPNSSMTNATVADTVKRVNGRDVTVTYLGVERKISIQDATPIVTFAPASLADLKPGAIVFVPAERDAAGAVSARQVVVGVNGAIPPM